MPDLPSFLARIFALLTLFATAALSQEPEEKEDEGEAAILLRILCKQPVAGATDLAIVQEGGMLHELEIKRSLVTEPLPVARGELFLVRKSGDDPAKALDPFLKLTIPDAGKRFVLALFAAPEPTPGKPYEHRLIRTDNLQFGVSDLYLFNLTEVPIGGMLGKRKFRVAPNRSKVVTPDPDQAGGRVYQSRFYFKNGDETRLFNDTRWPLSKSARVYLFFMPDPARRSIGYQTFREYAPFP
jgi:hypothetical protein